MSDPAALPVAILISGRGSNMEALLAAMAEPGFPARPALVAANLEGAAGLDRAREAGVPTALVEHRRWGPDREGFERALSAEIDAAGAELVLLAGFMRRLTPWFVGRWRDRLINIHPSLLPAFPGLATHARALEAGVLVHGCTVHLVRETVDEGPILGQAALAIGPEDDPDSLAARVLRLEHRLYPACLRAWASGGLRVEEGRVVGPRIAQLET